MGRAYGRRKRAEHRARIASLESAIETMRAEAVREVERAEELNRWLALAVDAALLLDDPRRFGRAPESALAIGELSLEFEDIVESHPAMSRAPAYRYRHGSTARGALRVVFLSNRFRHVGDRAVLSAGEGRRDSDLHVALEREDSALLDGFNGDGPSIRLQFLAITTDEQRQPVEQARLLQRAVLSSRLAYLLPAGGRA